MFCVKQIARLVLAGVRVTTRIKQRRTAPDDCRSVHKVKGYGKKRGKKSTRAEVKVVV